MELTGSNKVQVLAMGHGINYRGTCKTFSGEIPKVSVLIVATIYN